MACPRNGCRFQIFPQKPTETQINKSLLRWIWHPILIILQRKNHPSIDQSSWLTILWLILWLILWILIPIPTRQKANKLYKIWCHPNFSQPRVFSSSGVRWTPPRWTAGSNDRPAIRSQTAIRTGWVSKNTSSVTRGHPCIIYTYLYWLYNWEGNDLLMDSDIPHDLGRIPCHQHWWNHHVCSEIPVFSDEIYIVGELTMIVTITSILASQIYIYIHRITMNYIYMYVYMCMYIQYVYIYTVYIYIMYIYYYYYLYRQVGFWFHNISLQVNKKDQLHGDRLRRLVHPLVIPNWPCFLLGNHWWERLHLQKPPCHVSIVE